jgi:mono/diheme cytochrome c family protein
VTGRRALLVTLVVALGCADHEFEPPDRAVRIARAESVYTSERFDTMSWASDSIRALTGNVVFSTSCRNCHGPLGEGGTPYAAQRNLDVPSLVAPGWPYAGQPDSVRHLIFIGHAHGMPTWGVAGLTDREVDAVAFYLTEVLRPEVLGEGGGG